MGDVQLPIKFSTGYYISYTTTGQTDIEANDSPFLLKPRLKLFKLSKLPWLYRTKRSTGTETFDALKKSSHLRRPWAIFVGRCNDSSAGNSYDSSSNTTDSSSCFSIPIERDKEEPKWDDKEDDGGDRSEEENTGCVDRRQVDLKTEDDGTDRSEEEEDTKTEEHGLDRSKEEAKRYGESLAFKLLVRLPSAHWERKLAAMTTTVRIVRMGIARLRSRAEEINIKMRTKAMDSSGGSGKVRVFRGEEEELWYLKKVCGMRCQPLAGDVLYGMDKGVKVLPLPEVGGDLEDKGGQLLPLPEVDTIDLALYDEEEDGSGEFLLEA